MSLIFGGNVDMRIMKLLKLCRLARLVRALRYSIFDELKQMVVGVIAGVQVLCWAIVMLFGCIFLIGLSMRILIGETEEEFRTVPHAMMTTFRCYTEGCMSYDGTPLTERLFSSYGGIFMVGYIISFMFVTVGVFNLIMAIFIENVSSSSEKRKLEELGKQAAQDKEKVTRCLTQLIVADPESAELIASLQKAGSAVSLDTLKEDYVVTRAKFHQWLHGHLLLDLFSQVGIEASTKMEMFDVLDVDMGGELTIDELSSGLMRLRGPVTKSDIVAIRLKIRHLIGLTAMMTDVWQECCPQALANTK
jgi:hypothetical protein